MSSRATVAIPDSIRERSRSSLTIWTRCPVSTSIFATRSAAFGGRESASAASVSARRLTVVSGVRSSWLRLSMNSARIRWRRRSSETSSRTSQASPPGVRRARARSVGPCSRRTVTSPTAEPVSSAVRAISSTWWSVNASSTLRPTIVPGRRPTSRWATSLAAATVRSGATRTAPTPTSSTRMAASCSAAVARCSAAAARSSAAARRAGDAASSRLRPAAPSRRPRRWSMAASRSMAAARSARRAPYSSRAPIGGPAPVPVARAA